MKTRSGKNIDEKKDEAEKLKLMRSAEQKNKTSHSKKEKPLSKKRKLQIKQKNERRREKRREKEKTAGKKRPRNSDAGSPQHKKRREAAASFQIRFNPEAPTAVHWGNEETTSLDSELEAFANYVRLGATERLVREDWVSKLHQIMPVRVFGSHTAPEVCAFCSDLDVCVLAEESDEDETPDYSHDRATTSIVDLTAASDDEKDTKTNKARLSLERRNRWIEALEGVDAINDASNGSCSDTEHQEDSKPPAVDRVASHGTQPTNSNNDDLDPFTIDRNGLPQSTKSDSYDLSDGDEPSDVDSADPLQPGPPNLVVNVSSAPDRQSSTRSTSKTLAKKKCRTRKKTKYQALQLLEAFRKTMQTKHRSLIVRSMVIRARVPIIKVKLASGFETDIACDNQLGNDTSLYAAAKVRECPR